MRWSWMMAGGMTALALAGCEVGPDFHAPARPPVQGFSPEPLVAEPAGSNPQRFTNGLDVSGRWWTLYQSPELDALMDRALQANPDLMAAQAALRAAQETYYAQRGASLPTVDAGYNLTTQRANGTLASPLSSNAYLFTLHTVQLNVAYTADVFGGIRRQTETVKAQAEAQRFQTEAVYLTLTSNLVAAVVQKAMLTDQIEATEALIKSDRDVLDIMTQQQAAGEIARADVAAQEAIVAQAEQTLPPLEKQRGQQQDLIANLTGRYPSEKTGEVRLASLTLPEDLPVSLPSKLVEQRPDIRAAESNLQAASAQVGVAMANRLPAFTIAANAGGEATNFFRMFSGSNPFWLASGGVVDPIFNGGALRHRQGAAEAALDQARDQYQSAVLAAFQNVADTLQALQSDARLLQSAAATEKSTQESLEIARRQFELGQVSGIPVLNAEQAYHQAVIARVQAQANRFTDTAALFQSLGGGWWNRNDTPTNSEGNP